jgi:hypothetical protein
MPSGLADLWQGLDAECGRPSHCGYVRYGSFTSILACPLHVRLPSISDRRADISNWQLRARKRHMHRSKTALLFDHVVCARPEKSSLPCSWIAQNEMRVPTTSHGRRPSDRSVGAQLMNSTLVPLWTIFARACASQLVRWTQPCDWVFPMLCGSGVPWMP